MPLTYDLVLICLDIKTIVMMSDFEINIEDTPLYFSDFVVLKMNYVSNFQSYEKQKLHNT